MVVGFLAAVFVPGWWRWEQLKNKATDLEEEITQLELENQRLLTELDRLENDPIYLERVARRKLGLAREGEVVYKGSSSPE